MSEVNEFFKVYYHKNNLKKSNRKLHIIKFNEKSNKCYSFYTYYKKKRNSDHNKLKVEKNERTKERDDKYLDY